MEQMSNPREGSKRRIPRSKSLPEMRRNPENIPITDIRLEQYATGGQQADQGLTESAASQTEGDLGVESTSEALNQGFEKFLSNNSQTSEAGKLIRQAKEKDAEAGFGGQSDVSQGDSGYMSQLGSKDSSRAFQTPGNNSIQENFRQKYEEMQQKFKALEFKNKSERILHEMEKEFLKAQKSLSNARQSEEDATKDLEIAKYTGLRHSKIIDTNKWKDFEKDAKKRKEQAEQFKEDIGKARDRTEKAVKGADNELREVKQWQKNPTGDTAQDWDQAVVACQKALEACKNTRAIQAQAYDTWGRAAERWQKDEKNWKKAYSDDTASIISSDASSISSYDTSSVLSLNTQTTNLREMLGIKESRQGQGGRIIDNLKLFTKKSVSKQAEIQDSSQEKELPVLPDAKENPSNLQEQLAKLENDFQKQLENLEDERRKSFRELEENKNTEWNTIKNKQSQEIVELTNNLNLLIGDFQKKREELNRVHKEEFQEFNEKYGKKEKELQVIFDNQKKDLKNKKMELDDKEINEKWSGQLDYLQKQEWFGADGKSLLKNERGKRWLNENALEFFQTKQGKRWFWKQRIWNQNQGVTDNLAQGFRTNGDVWLVEENLQWLDENAIKFFGTKTGQDWYKRFGNRGMAALGEKWLDKNGLEFLETEQGQSWFRGAKLHSYGWCYSEHGQRWLNKNGKEFLKTEIGQKWVNSKNTFKKWGSEMMSKSMNFKSSDLGQVWYDKYGKGWLEDSN